MYPPRLPIREFVLEIMTMIFGYSMNSYNFVTQRLILDKIKSPDRPPEMDAISKAQDINGASDVNAMRNVVLESFGSVMLLLVGGWLDKTGKIRPVLYIVLVGTSAGALVTLVGTYIWTFSPWICGGIEGSLIGLSGGRPVLSMASTTYISVKTSGTQRTNRLSILLLLTLLGGGIGNATSGYLMIAVGYKTFYILIISSFAICLLLTFFIKDPPQKPRGGKTLMSLAGLRAIYQPRPNFWPIWLLIIASVAIGSEIMSEGGVYNYYIVKTFSYSFETTGAVSSYRMAVSTIGSIIFTQIATKKLKWSDYRLGIIAGVIGTISTLLMSFANMEWEIYVFQICEIGRITLLPLIKSLLTSFLRKEETGLFLSLSALGESLVPIGLIPLYNKVFASNWPGSIFMLSSGITAGIVLLIIVTYYIHEEDPSVTKNEKTADTPANGEFEKEMKTSNGVENSVISEEV